MASRGRGYQSQEWEHDDFDNKYDAQYPDEDALGGVQLDHCKLYVKNIARGLNEEGLTAAFSKYGSLVKVYISKDPAKKYALITYETPGEAKLAMMKLNKTEPLKLNINIAHKKNNQESREDTRKYRQRECNSYRDDTSVSSKGRRKPDEFANGNINELEDQLCDEDLGLDEGVDTELELELTQLRLKQLRLQQQQLHCKQQMLLLNKGKKATSKSNRCILPDGRIVVRNTSDKSEQPDNTYSSAAGDSLTIPTLQRVPSRACLTCGGTTDAYCGRCGLAPYCSERCQMRDWNCRHKYVCHNLACFSTSELKIKEPVENVEHVTSAAASLRQPNLSQKRDRIQDVMKQKWNSSPNMKPSRTNPNIKNKTFRHPMKRDEHKEDAESFDRTDSRSVKSERQQQEKPNETGSETKTETVKPKPDEKPTNKRTPPKPPASVLDVTPRCKTSLPKEYLLETLNLGDTVLLSVDSTAAECRVDSGYVCLTLHETNESDYRMLCGEFGEEGLGVRDDQIDPACGALFALRPHGEAAWYRARSVRPGLAALVDCGRLAAVSAADRCAALPQRYSRVPECCCRLLADAVQLGDNLKCTLISKTADGYKVSLENAMTGAPVGEGEASRWRPTVEYEVATPVANGVSEVPRPAVSRGPLVAVHVSGDEVWVRGAGPRAQACFEGLVQDGLEAGLDARPLACPPRAGQSVLSRHADGNCYRALCKRTNVKRNKYMIEFIEYGNTDICTMEDLYPCPQELELANRPTVVSLVKLDLKLPLNRAGTEYLERLRDDEVELGLANDKSESIPSGSVVELIELKSKESITKKLERLCSPEWKKMEERGGDVVDCKPLMYSSLQYHELPPARCRLIVLDVSTLRGGALGVCDAALAHHTLLADLTTQIEAYVNSELGREPYLPKIEELCLAQCPPYPQYFRAVLCSHAAGSPEATVCYVDYNNVESVPVRGLRKMMPEFVATPALACHAEIRGFPAHPSDAQLARAVQHMGIDDEGRGELVVERCEVVDPGFYVLDAPALLAAMGD